MSCKSRAPVAATGSVSLILFLLTDDAVLMVNSAVGKTTRLVLWFLSVLCVHAFGVDAALHVHALGVATLVTLVYGVAVLGVEAPGVDAASSDDTALLDEATLLPFALQCHAVCRAFLLHSDGH